MPVKNVYVTNDNEFELFVEDGVVCVSLIIRDDKNDATSNSCELKFDRPTIKKFAQQILDVCQRDFLTQKIKV